MVERLRLIGSGNTSEVFAWDRGRVLKLCRSWVRVEHVQREYANTRALHAAGLPVPATYDLVEFKGRHGIVFERIDGISLLKQVQTKPWTIFAAAQQLAELHAYIHTNVAPPELPPQRQLLKKWIEAAEGVSASQRQAAHDRLNQMPDSNMVCHGDFHADSTILTKRGPIIIDWMTAARGYPLADVARTSAILEGADPPREMGLVIRCLFKGSRQLLHTAYLKRYLQLHTGTRNEIKFWGIVQQVAMAAGGGPQPPSRER